jgi:hypothetical protein
MSPLAASLAGVSTLSLGFGYLLSRVDGLGFFVPKSTRGISASAQSFCTDKCRTAGGHCPLTHSSEAAADCPLWNYVHADMPTAVYGSPFAA